jgi:hypothetical protein
LTVSWTTAGNVPRRFKWQVLVFAQSAGGVEASTIRAAASTARSLDVTFEFPGSGVYKLMAAVELIGANGESTGVVAYCGERLVSVEDEWGA